MYRIMDMPSGKRGTDMERQLTNPLIKTYSEMFGIGRTRYSVTYYTGVHWHSDGSPAADIRLFGNKRELARFIRTLKQQGYKER